MIPPLIIQQAVEQGIGLIAITDHNSSSNAKSVMIAASGSGVHVLPGVELQTREEIHSICLFDSIEQCEAFQQIVDNALPDLKNNVDVLGEQYVVDPTGDFIREEDRLLIVSTSLTLETAHQHVRALGGVLIPAHVNRAAYGLLPVLGFFPPTIDFPFVEISASGNIEKIVQLYPQLSKYTLIIGGDAHSLDGVLGLNSFTIEKPCVAEIIKAARMIDGRNLKLLV